MKHIALAFLFCMSVISCAPQQPQKITLASTFDKEKAKKIYEHGSNSIIGSALLRQKGGGVVTCAGNRVSLIPVTDYSSERMAHQFSVLSGVGLFPTTFEFIPDDNEYYKYIRREMCDAQGSFEFINVADGDYFVTTSVTWTVGNRLQGGPIMQRVSVSNNTKKKIVVTD